MGNEIFSIICQNDANILGCTKKELKLIQSITHVKFPSSYLVFLELMGKKAFFLEGDSCFINELPFLNTWANEITSHHKHDIQLKEDDFVFWMSQGVMFCFFNLNEGEDPPIYCYKEGSNQETFIKISETFTDFLKRRFYLDKNLFSF
jgi:hypothetical protein